MNLPDLVEKANQPQVSIPTTTTAATVGLLSASEWLTVLSICVVVMQLIIALPKFISTVKNGWRWLRNKFKGDAGNATSRAAVAFASAGGLAVLLTMATPVVQGFEGKTNHAVIPVPGDVPTICHGHTKTAAMGQFRTDEECEKLLRQDLTESFNAVARHVQVDLPAETWVALASFEFNIGEGNFARSTAVKKINAGDLRGGCEAIATKVIVNGRCSGYGCGWSGGRQFKGLQNRRITEREMCLKGLVPKVVVTAEPPWWKFWARWV